MLDAFNFAVVHPHRGARHPLGGGGNQITEEIGNLLRFSKAADADSLRKFFDRLVHGQIESRRPLLKEGLAASRPSRRRVPRY